MTDKHKDIEHAILAIYKEVGYVQKTGKIEHGKTKYSYAGETDLIRATRPIMVKHGVTMRRKSVDSIDVKVIEQEKQKYGSNEVLKVKSFRVTTVETYVFSHAESGTKVEVQAVGCGHDSMDKAEFKAMTGAYKYALRNTFCIETGDDPDSEPSREVRITDTQQGREDAMSMWNEKDLGKKEHFYTNMLAEIQAIGDSATLKKVEGKLRWCKALKEAGLLDDTQHEDLRQAYKQEKTALGGK